MTLLPVNLSTKSESYSYHLWKVCVLEGYLKDSYNICILNTAMCYKHVFTPCQMGKMKLSKSTKIRYGSGSVKYIFKPLEIRSLRSSPCCRKVSLSSLLYSSTLMKIKTSQSLFKTIEKYTFKNINSKNYYATDDKIKLYK